jgi:hypothetical protein
VKQVFLCLLLGALPAPGGDAFTRPISLYTEFREQPADVFAGSLQAELTSIMEPLGLHFAWRSLALHGNEISAELAVIRFKGRCGASHLPSAHLHPGALGWTHVSDGIILPFSDVDCDRIRAFVQQDLLSFPPPRREGVFARAVARVLAHELYHIFANTARHAACGLGKARYTVQDLLGDEFAFESRESDALRDRPRAMAVGAGSF